MAQIVEKFVEDLREIINHLLIVRDDIFDKDK